MELDETRGLVGRPQHTGFPWATAFRSGNMWATMGVAYCYVYTLEFFQSWFHTYLVKARGDSEHDSLLSSLPFLVGAGANFGGGLASISWFAGWDSRWGRRSIGVVGLGMRRRPSSPSSFTEHWLGALVLLSLAYGGITFQQPTMFAVCLYIGGEYAGAVVGAMNTAAQVGSFVGSLAFGYLVHRYGSYNVPFIPMAALLRLARGSGLRLTRRSRSGPPSRPRNSPTCLQSRKAYDRVKTGCDVLSIRCS